MSKATVFTILAALFAGVSGVFWYLASKDVPASGLDGFSARWPKATQWVARFNRWAAINAIIAVIFGLVALFLAL